jgi:hypothetical protein
MAVAEGRILERCNNNQVRHNFAAPCCRAFDRVCALCWTTLPLWRHTRCIAARCAGSDAGWRVFASGAKLCQLTEFAASRMVSATASGCEYIATCDELTSLM